MPYPNGDLTLDEQVDQHMENKAISKEMSACWDEGYAEGRKAINAALLAALVDAEPVIALCAERYEVQDVCVSEELCGNAACDRVGCLCEHRNAVLSIIARAKGE